MFSQIIILSISMLTGFSAQPTHVRAYLDPGSGSILLQLLIAAILGAILVLRTSWGKIKAFFSRLFSRNVDKTE
jgi:hypothetical protein